MPVPQRESPEMILRDLQFAGKAAFGEWQGKVHLLNPLDSRGQYRVGDFLVSSYRRAKLDLHVLFPEFKPAQVAFEPLKTLKTLKSSLTRPAS